MKYLLLAMLLSMGAATPLAEAGAESHAPQLAANGLMLANSSSYSRGDDDFIRKYLPWILFALCGGGAAGGGGGSDKSDGGANKGK